MEIVHKGMGNFILNGFKLLFLFSLTACAVNKKNFKYFENLQNGNLETDIPVPSFRIEPNDLLAITITSSTPEAAKPYNDLTSTGAGSTGGGYLVSGDGYIEMPVLGSIKVAGLTKEQLRVNIKNSLVERKLLVDPAISIRVLTFKVTIVGEVAKPSVINVPSEKISLVDALALSGDLTPYGRRDNILIIRDDNGQKLTRRINLNSLELFHSDFYYLKANDIVYVEPTKAKIINSTTRTPQWVGFVLSAVTLAISVITFARQK